MTDNIERAHLYQDNGLSRLQTIRIVLTRAEAAGWNANESLIENGQAEMDD